MAYPLTEDQWGVLSDREALLIASATHRNQEYTARLRSKQEAFVTRIEKQVAKLPDLLAWQNRMVTEIKTLRAQVSAGNANAHAALCASSSKGTTRPTSPQQAVLPQCNATHAIAQASDQPCSVQQYATQKATEQLLADLDIDRAPTDAVNLRLFTQQLQTRARKIEKNIAKRATRRQNRKQGQATHHQ